MPASAEHPLAPADAHPGFDIPLTGWGLAEHAAAALFLAGDDSSYVTGVALPVDSGSVTG